jgi:hypothetical protein
VDDRTVSEKALSTGSAMAFGCLLVIAPMVVAGLIAGVGMFSFLVLS